MCFLTRFLDAEDLLQVLRVVPAFERCDVEVVGVHIVVKEVEVVHTGERYGGVEGNGVLTDEVCLGQVLAGIGKGRAEERWGENACADADIKL